MSRIINNYFIAGNATVVGDVELKAGSSIWYNAVVRGDLEKIVIGSNSNIQDGCIIHTSHKNSFNTTPYKTIIGDNVTVGHRVILHGCTIKNNSLIGMGAIILDGAVVGENVIVGAGSLVTQNKKLDNNYLYYGNPVKKIRALREDEIAFIQYNAEHYSKLKDQQQQLQVIK